MKMNLTKNGALMAGLYALLSSSLSTQATEVFPIADNPNPKVLQMCGGLAYDGTNYLAALEVGQFKATSEVGAQLVSPAGTLLGSLVNVGSSSAFPPAGTAAFGGGAFLEIWSDNTVKSGAVDMFGQRISPTGAKLGTRFPLLSSVGSHGFQTVRALGFGGTNFLVVWQDGANRNFFGQIVTTSGGLSGPEFLISDQQENGSWAAAASDGTNFLVVWQSADMNGDGLNATYGSFVSSSGSAGSPFQISQTDSLDNYYPLTVAFDGTNYLVIWDTDTLEDAHGNGVDFTLYGRLVSPGGALSASEVILAGDPGSTNYDVQEFPNLAFDGQNYLLVWTRMYAGGLTNANFLSGQFFDRSASPVGTNFAALPAMGTNRPVLALNGLVYDGTRFVLAGAYGRLIDNAAGDVIGIAYWQTWGVFIPTNQMPPTIVTEPISVTNLEGTTATFTVVVGGSALDYQWFKNDAKVAASTRISGVNSASLTISNLALADHGTYFLVASNVFGTTNSSNATLTVVTPVVIAPESRPTCTITSPANNATVTNSSVTLKGTTHDNEAVTNVYFKVDAATTWTAVGAEGTTNGFTNWSVVVNNLAAGSNTIKLYAVNATNETSDPTNKLNIFYKVLAPLTVYASGPGTLSYSNNQPLVIGKPYTITATADMGCKLISWVTNGVPLTNVTSHTLKFVMAEGMSIVAVFEEVSKPSITITAPASTRTSNPVVSLSGTASDDIGVVWVYYSINSGPTNYAVVTTNVYTNWSAVLILSPGTNVVRFYAQNAGGLIGSAAITLHDLAGGFAPQSVAGLIFYAQPSNSAPYQVFLGMSTWAWVRGSNFSVGDYWYNQVDSNTAQITSWKFAPEAGAGGSDVTTLTFASSTGGTYFDTNGGGTFELGGATGAAPSNLNGTTLEGAGNAGGSFTNHYTNGTFTADNLPGGVVGAGSFTYALYSPQTALLTDTFTNVELVGVTNFVLLDFETVREMVSFDGAGKDTAKAPRTNSGTFYSAATTPVAAAYYDSGSFTNISPGTAPAGVAPESLAGWTAAVTVKHTKTNGTTTTVVTYTPLLSFSGATFGKIDSNTNDNTDVGNYTYTRTGTNTGVLSFLPIAPPTGTNNNNTVLLDFIGPKTAKFTNGHSSGTVTISQQAATVPASLVGDKLIFTPASPHNNTKVVTFSYDTLTSASGTNTPTTKSYTFAPFGPQVAMVQDWNDSGTNYITMWFTSATPPAGSFVAATVDTNGSVNVLNGTFRRD
jgi:hypothetical protein